MLRKQPVRLSFAPGAITFHLAKPKKGTKYVETYNGKIDVATPTIKFKENEYNVISIKTKIPVYELDNDITKEVKNIENNLRDNIIGQDNAIDKLIEITKKIKLGIKDKNKSYSLLFCGPSGVGKTYLAKIFSESLSRKNVRITRPSKPLTQVPPPPPCIPCGSGV